MIVVTRMSGDALYLNATMIELIEHTPDTVITLYSGKKYVVRESAEDVALRATEYYMQIGLAGTHGGRVKHLDES